MDCFLAVLVYMMFLLIGGLSCPFPVVELGGQPILRKGAWENTWRQACLDLKWARGGGEAASPQS